MLPSKELAKTELEICLSRNLKKNKNITFVHTHVQLLYTYAINVAVYAVDQYRRDCCTWWNGLNGVGVPSR
jgi:hypothetical protein